MADLDEFPVIGPGTFPDDAHPYRYSASWALFHIRMCEAKYNSGWGFKIATEWYRQCSLSASQNRHLSDQDK